MVDELEHVPALALLNQLQGAIREGATLEEAEAWWAMVTAIDHGLALSPRQSAEEKAAVYRLREGVGGAIRSVREGWPNVLTGPARSAILGLQRIVRRGAVGVDGWPLKP